MHAGHMLHCKDNLLEKNVLVLVEKWHKKQSERRRGTQEAEVPKVWLWFMAKHMFGSFAWLNMRACMSSNA